MEAFELTPIQKLGLDLGRNIALRAGAGSGKTAVLKERYLKILDTHRDSRVIDGIVAITFTDKAALEMKTRILKGILERLSKVMENGTKEECDYWVSVRDSFHKAHISTIHGFCTSLLKEYPVEAGVDPYFTVLDSPATGLLLKELVADFIRILNRDKNPAFSTLSKYMNSKTMQDCFSFLYHNRFLTKQWLQYISNLDENSLEKKIRQDFDLYTSANIWEIWSDQSVLNASNEILENLKYCHNENDKLYQEICKFQDFCRNIVNNKIQDFSVESIEHYCEVINKTQTNWGVQRNWDPSEKLTLTREAVKILKTKCKKMNDLAKYKFNKIDSVSVSLTFHIANLYKQFEGIVIRENLSRNTLDFDDLLLKTLDMLTSPSNVKLLNHLSTRFRWFMVDEFQDTNELQWLIIRQLVKEKGSLSKDKLFVVGDEKQSIYSFRGADVTVFDRVKQEISDTNAKHKSSRIPMGNPGDIPESVMNRAKSEGIIELNENFRSVETLVQTGNLVFRKILQDTSHENNKTFQAQPGDLKCCSYYPPAAGLVELIVVPQSSRNNNSSKETHGILGEATCIATRINEIISSKFPIWYREDGSTQAKKRNATYSDITILLRKKTNIKIFERALREQDINYVVIGGIGFFQRQEIMDMLNLLRFLVDTRQDISLVGILRSPLFGLNDDSLLAISRSKGKTFWEKLQALSNLSNNGSQDDMVDMDAVQYATGKIHGWINIAHRVPPSELLNRVLEETGAWGSYSVGWEGKQALANLEKLVIQAHMFDSHGINGIEHFTEHLEKAYTEEIRESEAMLEIPDQDAVRIMTIHVAKGLEFNIVFIPELHKNMYSSNHDPSFFLEKVNGCPFLGFSLINPWDSFQKKPNLVKTYFKPLNMEKTIAEEKRVFYVAWTRTQQHLVLVTQDTKPKKKDSKKNTSIYTYLRQLFPELDKENVNVKEKIDEPRLYEIKYNNNKLELMFKKIITPLSSMKRISLEWKKSHKQYLLTKSLTENIDSKKDIQLSNNIRHKFSPVKVDKPMVYLSPTSYISYLQCPAGYYFKEILGIKESDFILESTQEIDVDNPVPGHVIGTITHNLLQKLYPGNIPSQEDALTFATREITNKEIAVKIAKDVYTQMLNLLDSQLGKTLMKCKCHVTEIPFQLRINNTWINGIIDRLYAIDENHSRIILDYKTNHVAKDQISTEIQKHFYHVQMKFYALAVHEALVTNNAPIKTQLFFTNPAELWEQEIGKDELAKFKEEIMEISTKIQIGVFIAKPTIADKCDKCVFMENNLCISKGHEYNWHSGYRYTILPR